MTIYNYNTWHALGDRTKAKSYQDVNHINQE